VLLLLIVNAVNFGTFLHAWISVANAARTGVQYYSTGGVSIGGLALPLAGAVEAMVVSDLSSLPNSTSIQVCVSRSNPSTSDCNDGKTAPAGVPPAADTPEGSPAVTYVIAAVDVSYIYQPIIPLWEFPGLGIHATIPTTAIHRQVRMRILN
jgi:hypothetical protein